MSVVVTINGTQDAVADRLTFSGFGTPSDNGDGSTTIPNAPGFIGTPPINSTSTGIPGQWSADSSFYYVCYSPNTWRRVATSTF